MRKTSLFFILCYITTVFLFQESALANFKNKKFRNNLAFGLTVARDINPDPNIVEINLEAREDFVEIVQGIPTKVYTYNGTVPGPLIRARVGNKLIVHFTNNLPEPTTIHWHGLRLPADMDGAAVAQNPIQPGQTFRYEFELKDASLFWYHPHVRSNEQVEKGLAGAMLVSPPIGHGKHHHSLKHISKIKQKVLVLDDVLLNSVGQIEDAFTGTAKEKLLKKFNGRSGNTLLVNGHTLPTMRVKSGETIRWRMVNIANNRFMKVVIPGFHLTRIGGDGGLLGMSQEHLHHVKLVPGERADVVFTPHGRVGTELIVYWRDSVRGVHTVNINNGNVMIGQDPNDGRSADIPLMRLVFTAGSHNRRNLHVPKHLRTITPINTLGANQTTLRFGHSTPQANGNVNFLINGKRFDQLTSADAPDARVGEAQVWNLVNMTMGDHPFHLHGFFFQVLETIKKDMAGNVIEIIPAPAIEDKDMINLPRRPGPRGTTTTVKIAVKFDPAPGITANQINAFGGVSSIVNANLDIGQRGHSGGWQFHCHILEHADLGMMSFVEVRN